MGPNENSDEHKKWRTDVDRNLGEISANVHAILENQAAQAQGCNQRYGSVSKRVRLIEASSVAENAVKKWKERTIGFLLSLVGFVAGIVAKIVFDK